MPLLPFLLWRRRSWGNFEPIQRVLLGDKLAVVGEQLAGGVPHFEGNLIGGFHDCEPVAPEAVPESVPLQGHTYCFTSGGEDAGNVVKVVVLGCNAPNLLYTGGQPLLQGGQDGHDPARSGLRLARLDNDVLVVNFYVLPIQPENLHNSQPGKGRDGEAGKETLFGGGKDGMQTSGV